MGIIGQVWYWIVSIPDLYTLTYFVLKSLFIVCEVNYTYIFLFQWMGNMLTIQLLFLLKFSTILADIVTFL